MHILATHTTHTVRKGNNFWDKIKYSFITNKANGGKLISKAHNYSFNTTRQMKTISEMGNVVYMARDKIKMFPWVSLKCQQNTFPGGKLSPTLAQKAVLIRPQHKFLHHMGSHLSPSPSQTCQLQMCTQ